MLARILLVLDTLIFLVLIGPCTTGMPLLDHRPAVTAAEKAEDAQEAANVAIGVKVSGIGIIALLIVVLAQAEAKSRQPQR